MTSTEDNRALSPEVRYYNESDDSDNENCDFRSCSDDECEDEVSSSDDEELTFREKLMNLFIDLNIEQSKGTAILKLLRTHRCFKYLPADHRTLVKTPRRKFQLRSVTPGEYIHLGIAAQLKEYLSRIPSPIPNELIVDISTDGANMDHQSTINMWPIQMRVVNIKKSTPIIIGIYRGLKKPASSRDFFSDFTFEWLKIQEGGGITIEDRKIKLFIRCVIADAPARAFLLCHVGHTGYNNCSKCTQDGTLRTDESYAAMIDESHHHESSFLADLGIGMVSQVPFEGMHLTQLGSKRQIKATVTPSKRFNAYVRLDNTRIDIISSRMSMISEYTPREFSRKPTDIRQYYRMKATELRQIILYTGPVIYHGVYKQNVYEHYLMHHTALRCLSSAHPAPGHLNVARELLKEWVRGCAILYGQKFVSYNIHGHLHQVDDVARLGPLDSFSAYPYENQMQYLRAMLRKPGQPLQQIARRIQERANRKKPSHEPTSVKPSQPHTNGPLMPNNLVDCNDEYVQYNLIKTDDFTLGTNQRDNCCILNDLSVCLVLNIFASSKNKYILGVQKFQTKESWFNAVFDSTELGSFKCSELNPTLHYVDLCDIVGKCYRTPYWPYPEGNDLPPVNPSTGIFIATVML